MKNQLGGHPSAVLKAPDQELHAPLTPDLTRGLIQHLSVYLSASPYLALPVDQKALELYLEERAKTATITLDLVDAALAYCGLLHR